MVSVYDSLGTTQLTSVGLVYLAVSNGGPQLFLGNLPFWKSLIILFLTALNRFWICLSELNLPSSLGLSASI